MCGFAGYIQRGGVREEQARSIAMAMAAAVAHRGPDDSGVWVDGKAGIALAHQRLSVLELSPAGHQPMISPSGRFVIVFNGEIYNHLKLRGRLGSILWRGHSDTETLLAAIDAWGVSSTLKKCVGMFAFGLWDRKNRVLTLARDRLGEKPLYYGWQGRTFYFGSELKAINAHPEFIGEVDRKVLSLSLLFSCVPGSFSIYEGIQKLTPGTFLEIHDNGDLPKPSTYWSLSEAVVSAKAVPFRGDETAAVIGLEACLKESVAGQMVADVPVGVFLSGGVDSSVVTALMQAQSSRKVRTFSIGFDYEGYNEAEYAKEVARYLGTEHTEFYVTSKDALDLVPHLPSLYDEPFSDSSQIPTFLVSKLARQYVTVALSGDGGDELFGGYYRYLWSVKLWHRVKWLPFMVRNMMGHGLLAFPPEILPSVMKLISRIFATSRTSATDRDRLHRWAMRLTEVKSLDDLFWSLIFTWKNVDEVVVDAGITSGEARGIASCPHQLLSEERMMFLDTMTYLPDDILTKVDRAAMGVSLETRVPLLDHRVVEFAWRLPLSMKIRNGKSKWILRKVLYNYVPQDLIERPKMGFGIPLALWLRGPLRDWVEALLDEARLRREGFFHPEPIREKWQEHLSGEHNWAHYLWIVLMFQAWLEVNA